MDRRQGNFEKAIEDFKKAIQLDPRNTFAMVELAEITWKCKALSQLAAVDALLNSKETAISEGKTAVEMTPIFKDAVDGPFLLANLAIVYAWAGELDLAFATLESLKRTPSFIGYGDFKRDSLWTPLRKGPRFDPLLAELAPRN
jgi:tetratricopeptide (TPR) repeat protein